MKNNFISKHTTRVKKQLLLLAVLFLGCLIFFNCGRNNPETNNAGENPFVSATNNEDTTQLLHPCRWTYKVEQSSPGEATLISIAKLDSGWHLYSQHIVGKGPSTEFVYDSLLNYKLVGDTNEGEPKKEYNPYLEMEVLYFENEAIFKQRIKVLSKEDFAVNGTIDYMVCLTQCVLSDEEFSFKVKGNPEGK